MAMEITNNYSSYAAQGMAGSCAPSGAKKKETEKKRRKQSETANPKVQQSM